MFGRWLNVRIRAAENALAAGRIDEAYAIATGADVRSHRQIQAVWERLARPLLARARIHVQAGRYREALADLDRLREIGQGGSEAENLRQRAAELGRDRYERAADRNEAVREAEERLAAGRLESGRLAIERVDNEPIRERLLERLDARVERSGQLLQQAAEALERGDVAGAVNFWSEACARHGRSRESDALAGRLTTAWRKTLDDWFAAGRIERFLAARAASTELREFDPTLCEYEQKAALCARASTQLGGRDFNGLRESLLRLRSAAGAQAGGAAAWLDEALAAVGTVSEGLERLLASPLGLYASQPGRTADAATAVHRGEREEPRPRARAAAASGWPVDPRAAAVGAAPLIVLVDGAGSSLLLGQDTVQIGRAGRRAAVDVPVPADILSHHADLVREGDDYFINAHGPATVNQRAVKRALLHDGDRIVLGSKAKLVFRKPSMRSASAVLTMSHRSRLAQDVGQVILFRDTCLIGPQASCHVRTPDGQAQVVLFEREGRLYAREATSAGGKLGDPRAVPLEESQDFGEVRVTVKRYDVA